MSKLFSVELAISPLTSAPGVSTDVYLDGSGVANERIGVAAIRFAPHMTGPALGAQRASRLLLCVMKEGIAYFSQDGRRCQVGPGDIVLIDPSRPFQAETGDMLTHSLYIPKSAVCALVPNLDSFTARPFDGRTGVGAIIRTLVDELITQSESIEPPALDLITDSVPSLVAALFSSQAQSRSPVLGRQQLAHRHRVRRFITENLRDPDLRPAIIAAGVNLSVRYVYELFAEEGQSPMRMVWDERLERCRKELADGAMAARSIGEIASGWGFSNMAHFSRAFRKAYGCRPGDCRGTDGSESARSRAAARRQTAAG